MIEIRRIREDEAEQFLELLCHVFSLDVTRARPVYYDNVLFDLNRKWAVCEGGELRSILTTTGLTFGWGRCIGIAGVATMPQYEGRGYAGMLLEKVLETAEQDAEGPAMLFAHKEKLYKRLGFQLVDEVIRGTIMTTGAAPQAETLPTNAVQSHYSRWSQQSPDRLVRTPDRWRYWGLSCRICEPMADGYFIPEPGLVREAVTFEPCARWEVPQGSQWYGLRSVTKACDVPVRRCRTELLFMTRNVPGQPQMFMTDQF